MNSHNSSRFLILELTMLFFMSSSTLRMSVMRSLPRNSIVCTYSRCHRMNAFDNKIEYSDVVPTISSCDVIDGKQIIAPAVAAAASFFSGDAYRDFVDNRRWDDIALLWEDLVTMRRPMPSNFISNKLYQATSLADIEKMGNKGEFKSKNTRYSQQQ